MLSVSIIIPTKNRYDALIKALNSIYCIRLRGTYLIDPRCKLTHHAKSVGREDDHWARRHARAYAYLYLRNWSSHKLAYG